MKKREILQFSDVLFAHTDAFNFPALFANRIDSRAFVMDLIRANDRRVIVISDILGSGKTFLLNMIVNELQLASHKTALCGRIKPEALRDPSLIVIDEWDIKANPKRFNQSLEMLANARGTNKTPTILLGDYTLRSAGVREALGGAQEIVETPMEPLNPRFFNLALQNRIARVREKERPEDVEDVDREIVAAALAEALAPAWDVTSANFRDVFRTLIQLCGHMAPDNDDGAIGAAEASAWVAARAPQDMDGPQTKFFNAYVNAIRESVRARGWSSIAPMSLEDAAPLGPSGISLEALRAEIVEPLARTPGLVAAMGTPQVSALGDAYDRFPGPYLPGVYTRLSAAFGV